MEHLLEFFHSEHDDYLLDAYLHMFQVLLLVSPPSKFYKVSIVLFHKYLGTNVAVKNFMSHFSMFYPTKATMKLANGNTGHAQGIGIIVCCFHNCSIIYLVGPVCYCPGHPPTPSNQFPSNFMFVFRRLHNNILNIVIFLTLRVVLGDHPARL